VSAWDGILVSVDSIFKGALFALVVDNSPCHSLFVETSCLSIRVEDLSISVSELPNDSTFFSADSSYFTVACRRLADDLLSSLTDLSISKILDE
jgi:hypothetical protein